MINRMGMKNKLFCGIFGFVLYLIVNGNALAGSLSLLNHLQYTPEERSQGTCGNCWVWASTGVMEIALDVQKGIKDRLSAQYLNSCKTDNFACCGGNARKFADWYKSEGFAIPWSNANAAFEDDGTSCLNGSITISCDNISTIPNYPIISITAESVLTLGVGQSTAIANIKNILNQNKAIFMAFWLPNSSDWTRFYNFWYGDAEDDIWNPDLSCGHAYGEGGSGHAVLLVGYNDDDPNPSNHYWILLNSWGIANGQRPNGLFRMAMNINYDCSYPYGYRLLPALGFYTLNTTFGSSATCTYSISPTSNSFSSSGGSGSVSVTTQSGCSWTVTENLDWVTINSGSSGTGSGIVNYSVSANPDTSYREGEITIAGKTIAGKTFELKQEGSSTIWSNILLNLNSDFESGYVNWSEYSSGGYKILTNYEIYAFSGSWFAWLGGYDSAVEYIYQDVTIPSNATSAFIDFFYWISTDETTPLFAFDKMAVEIRRPSDNALLRPVSSFSNLNWSNNWLWSGFYNISEFLGQTIRLRFYTTTDYSSPTSFFMDNIRLWVAFPAKPNLKPYQLTGWSDKIVVSKITGTNTDSSPLYTTDILYVDWAVINNGSGAISARFYYALSVDGVFKQEWHTDPPLNANASRAVTDFSIGSLSAGTHTIKIVVDSTGVIAESNEGDNEYTKTITVQPAGCSYSISPPSNSFSGGGGSGSVNVTAGAGCAWTAFLDPGSWGWLGISAGASNWGGTGSGTVNYYYFANNTGQSRTGKLHIAGQDFQVTQEGQ